MRYVVFWRHHPGGSIGDPSVPSLRDQQCGSCSWPTHVPTEKREHVMRVWIHCDEGVNTLWWGCEYTVMTVWIQCDEGVNTLWWGCEWCVNEERCMKSCTYLLYDVRSSEVSMYLWNRHASLCSKRITSKWLLLPWEGSVSASCAGGHFVENECIRFVCRKWVYHMFTFNLLNAMGQ